MATIRTWGTFAAALVAATNIGPMPITAMGQQSVYSQQGIPRAPAVVATRRRALTDDFRVISREFFEFMNRYVDCRVPMRQLLDSISALMKVSIAGPKVPMLVEVPQRWDPRTRETYSRSGHHNFRKLA